MHKVVVILGRYAHAKQFKRHQRALRFLRTRLGRLIRDIRRKIVGDGALQEVFATPLSRASGFVQSPADTSMSTGPRATSRDELN